jgi:glycerol-3-phosphate acyltransferase PlsX
MRIVVDVMGGDHGCGVIVAGAKLALAANAQLTQLFLVGDERQIQTALAQNHLADSRVKVIHASEVLTMEDKPLEAVRKKKDSSMVRAIELVREGEADAVISVGNTGGLVTAATLKLRRLEGVERPAIATVLPSLTREFVLLDAGANSECKPIHLVQFAIMGSIYSHEILGRDRPRVGVLCNGTEEHKGNDLTREARELLAQVDLNSIGYTEGFDLFNDRVEVVVTDGFVGNIVLKTAESLGGTVVRLLKSELTANPLRKFGALLSQGALRTIKRRMDPEAYGGAPLLGVKGCVIKAHGSAREKSIMNAIRVAGEAVGHHINDLMVRDIARANERLAPAKSVAPAPVHS